MKKSTLSEFNASLKQVSKRLQNNVVGTLYNEVGLLVDDLKERSPLDKDVFRRNWRSLRLSKTGRSSIFRMRVDNRTPYGTYLDQGAEPGEAPWYFPNPNSKPSGKLKESDGKIWAGGKSPSGFVIGGIIDKVIFYNNNRLDKIATKVAESVIGAI